MNEDKTLISVTSLRKKAVNTAFYDNIRPCLIEHIGLISYKVAL
ncbi:Uncharacterised protein [Vibrio cholerae]|nr:Uncharacterised protein [Vibrio cholerae]